MNVATEPASNMTTASMPQPRKTVVVSLTLAIACMALGTSGAVAHAALESSMPAANTTVSSPKLIQVQFSEALELKLSSLKLSSSDGTAIAVKPVTDPGKPALLAVMPLTALKAGLYTVSWSVVSADSHHTHGSFSFTVQ